MANKFLQSPFQDVTESLQSQQFQLPPLPEQTTPEPAPAVESAPAVPKARGKARSDNFLPPDEIRPMFEAAAREFDVPVNVLMALGHQESRYSPNAIGPATKWGRAKGMMQYLESTAKGLGINPFDPAEAIPAAAKQIRERLDKGYSMEDAVKEHFAGPDRKLWGEKTNVYGREVMEKVGRIGDMLGKVGASAGMEDKLAELNKDEPGRYVPIDEEKLLNNMSTGLPRPVYEHAVRLANPDASEDFIAQTMKQYDQQKTKAGANRVQGKFDLLQKDGGVFNQKLDQTLAGPQRGIVPQLPTRSEMVAKNEVVETEKPDDRGFVSRNVDYLGADLKIGWNNLLNSVEGMRASELGELVNAFNKGYTPEQIAADPELAARGRSYEESYARSMAKISKRNAENAKLQAGMRPETREFFAASEKEGTMAQLSAIGDAVMKNPVGVIADLGIQSGPQSLAMVAAAIAARLSGGTAGAAAVAGGGTSAALQFGGDYAELRQNGMAHDEAWKTAAAKSAVVGAFDAVSMNSAGKALDAVLGSGGVLKKSGTVVKELGKQSGLGMAGEAGGSLASGRKIEPVAVAAEGLGEIFGGPMEAIGTFRQGGKNQKGEIIGRELDAAVRGGEFNQEAIRQDAVRAMDPNQGVTPRGAAPQPAAETVTVTPPQPSQAAGPLSRAMENAAQQPERVTVTAPEGQITGFVQSHTEDSNGNSVTRILGDDGQVYTFTSADGVTITPEAGPLTGAMEKAAEQMPAEIPDGDGITNEPAPAAAEKPADVPSAQAETATAKDAPNISEETPNISEAAPNIEKPAELPDVSGRTDQQLEYLASNGQPGFKEAATAEIERRRQSGETKPAEPKAEAPKAEAKPEPRIEDMDEPQLRARLKYLAGQFRNASANSVRNKIAVERRAVEARINALVKEGEANGRNAADVQVRDDGAPSAEVAAKAQQDQPKAGARGRKSDDAGRVSMPAAPEAGNGAAVSGADKPADGQPALKKASKEDLEHLFGIDKKREKALERIAKGTAYFHDGVKAKDFIKKNGLSETHEAKQGKGGRWDIVAKATGKESLSVQPAAPVVERNEPEAGEQVIRTYKTKSGKIGATVKRNVGEDGRVTYSYIGEWGAGSGIQESDMLATEAGWKSSKRGFTVEGADAAPVNAQQPTKGERNADVGNEQAEATEGAAAEQAADGDAGGVQGQEAAEKVAPGTRINREKEKAAADRLTKLLDVMPANMKPLAQGARTYVKSVVEELRKEKTVTSVVENLQEASNRFLRAGHAPFSEVIDEVVETLQAATSGKEVVKTGDALADYWANSAGASIERDVKAGRSKVVDLTGEKPAEPNLTDKEGNKAIGRRADGVMIREDKNGVRFYAQDGVRISETVSMRPTRQGVQISRGELKPEFMTAEEASAAKAEEKPAVSANKVFTEDAAAKARALLKSKLSQLNSGVDPEIMQAGITLAGYHVEKGARTFAAYAKAMVEDLGEAVKPYLKSWYMGTKYDPRATGFDGMSTAAEVESADIEALTAETQKVDASATVREAAKQAGKKVAAEFFQWDKKASTTARVTTAVIDYLYANLPESEINKDLTALADEIVAEIAKSPATPTLDAKEAQNANETETAGSDGDRTLEGKPAEAVRGAEEGGNAEQRGAEGGREDAGRAGEADRAGDSARGGMGDGTGDVPVSARGGRGKRGSAGKRGVQAESAAQQADVGNVADLFSAETTQARKETVAGDYRITDLTRLGEGGQKTKYRNNVAAIRLLNELQETGRKATAAEQDVLARYVGWGGIAQAFDPSNKEWAEEYAELKALMTPEEWETANESTQYAHYTSQEIIGGMYDALKRIGFSGGKIIEPGSGVGNFMGLMPQSLRGSSRFTAVERERIAGGIAKMLYQNQNVQQQDFRSFNAQDGYFDAAIGNPPFSATTLTDLSGRKHLSGLSIHNYFFAKSVDMLREGGVLAMVVSNSFLDAKGDKARRYIGERTEFLGAIRLPNKAFAKNANTEVTTDIIFLKKRPESEWGSKEAKEDMKRWQGLATVRDPLGGEDIPLNQYFVDHPEMMLGRMERAGSMYRADQPALIAQPGQDTAALMQQAINRLPANVYTSAVVKNTADMQEAAIVALDNEANVDVGGHYVKDGSVFVRIGDVAGEGYALQVTATTKISEKRELGANGLAKLKALAEMRVTLRKLIAAEQRGDNAMDGLRATLNKQYDAYVKENGYLHQRGTVQIFGEDPDYPLLASLEHNYDPGIGAAAAKAQGVKAVAPSATKAPIFTKRAIESHEEITKADTPEDALMISIAERGQIDDGYIGGLLGQDGAEVLEGLTKGDKPALFIDPATGGYVLRDAYLSGNVRKKLAQAKAAGMYKNVAELEKVVPEDIPAHEISGKIGAPWVPTETYEQFAAEIMGEGTKARVVYVPAMSSYVTSFSPASEVSNKNTFGTSRMGADEIFAALLNSKEIKVGHYEEDPATRSRRFVLEKEPTDEANDKAREIKDKFNDWLFSDAERAEKMQRAYNDAVNNYVTRIFDGAMMKFPGKVPDVIIKLRRHQRNAVARIIQDGRALLDHVVGAGKTYTIIAAAMELKRTGLAKKPMIVVPNHLVKQWATDFYKLYPGANILTATKKDFSKANRRKFLAKIATGNWDAVIIAHSSYGFIKPDAEFETRFNQERIDEIVEAITALKEEGDQNSKRTVKQLAKMKESMENKLASLRDKPMDDLLDFGQLGVDQLFVDEAHLFKNLMFVTKMQNVRGLGQPKGSQRAYDMFIKTHQTYEKNGSGRGVVFATGTPVSNSLAEMYHMLRYLAPETLKDSGQFTFDAWAKTFADVEQVWMQSMSGDGYKASNRMSRFVNTPELLRVYDQVADTVTIDDIKQAFAEENNGKEFPIPKQKGGRRTPVSIPRTQEQTDYMAEVAKRAKELEKRKGKPQKGDDNMLSIMGDARKAAMDIRMVRPDITERDPNGRIAIAANNIFERYQQYNDVRGTQLVFSDMGTPKKHAEKELKEYNELMAAAAPLSDEKVQAMAELGDEAALEQIEAAEEAQRKIEAKGQDWLDAIQSAMRGFSIYDDLKAALVEKGIPEKEIAFIHDYNTDDQKAALFRAVNDGKVRVLLGSTEKMGAGTNVQERAVALHHLDVPWKPSDIEQREGRVIRQGNRLLDEIDGFEVEVMAYATQDTLDLFMWQTQEKKLSMIGQLRTGNVGREVDNAFEEMQMSAGEMQAAATSNPYLLEEIQLKDKVKRLERQKRSFDGQKNDLANRKRRAEKDIADLPAQIKQAEKVEKAAKATIDGINAHFEGIKATVNGETITGAFAIRAALRDAIAEAPTVEKNGKEVKQISVEFNGKELTSESSIADNANKELGDAAEIAYTLPSGETVYRAADVVVGLVDVFDSMTDNAEIGKVGDFEVTAYRVGEGKYDVIVSLNGNDVSDFQVRFNPLEPGAMPAALRQIPGTVQKVISAQQGLSDFLQSKLEKAKRALSDIESKPAAGEWEGDAELKKAREDYKGVLKKLAEREEEKPADGAEEMKFSVRQSRPLTKADTPITALMEHLSRNPEFFEYKTTISKSMDGIVAEIDPGYKVKEFGKVLAKDRGVDRIWDVQVPNSVRSAQIVEKGGEVWIDVSKLEAGKDAGSIIYAMAAAYAHNNGKVLIGDPAGLSRQAFYRRTENMLASALKYGTTRHLRPHHAQEIPGDYYRAEGHGGWGDKVRAINWNEGDDVGNIKELIYTAYKSALDNVPELKNVIFDPEQNGFTTLEGRPFTGEDFARLVSEHAARKSGPYSLGSRTAKRAALFNTLLRQQSPDGRKRLLDSFGDLLSRGRLSDPLRGIAYSTGEKNAGLTSQGLRESITSGITGKVVGRMIDDGMIVLHADENTLPAGAKGVRGVQAVTLPNGQIHLVASALTDKNARAVLLHEMFHAGGNALIGGKDWNALQGRLGSLYRQSERSTGKAREIFDRARARVEAAKGQGAIKNDQMSIEEFGAYLIEEYERAPESLPAAFRKWVEDVIGLVKAWAVARFGKQLGDVTPAQLAGIAKLALMDSVSGQLAEARMSSGEKMSAKRLPLGKEYVFHNTSKSALETILDEGMDAGTFSRKPIDFGGDVWIAVKETDLPGFQEHDYGGVPALETNWERREYDDDGKAKFVRNTISPDKIIVVDNRGRPIAYNDNIRFSVTPEHANKALADASEALDAPKAKDDYIGRVVGDISLGARLLNHPRQVAAVHPEFTPVYRTAISQMETRDKIIADFGADVHAYDHLDQAGKEAVNKVLELGRLTSTVFSDEELRNGVPNTGEKQVVTMVDGKPKVTTVPYQALLTSTGEVVKLSDEEIKAYNDLRNMFDRALDRLRDQTLAEMGFGGFAAMDGMKPLVIEEAEDGKVVLKGSVYTDEEREVMRGGDKSEIAQMLQGHPIMAIIKKFDGAQWNAEKFGYEFDARQREALEKELGSYLRKSAAAQFLELIDDNTPEDRAERLRNIAAFVAEIEQAKRAGYVPFARYGDYVVTVKEKIADVTYVEDDAEHYIANGVPDSFAPQMQEMGAEQSKEGWRIKKSQKADVEKLTEQTVYSAKVETGLGDLLDEKRAGKVDDIKAVKEAIEKAKAEWVAGHPNRRVVAFKVREKKSDQPVKLSDVDALAEIASIDNATWDAVRDKLADAIKAKGFRRHFFHSDNVPGYTGDFERSIADYVIGMSGYLSRRQHMKRWENAVSSIQDKPKLFEYANKYRNYVNDPQEELAMVRQIGFFSYIAGVMASAFANLTQVPLLTVPTLSQIAPMALVTKELAKAYKDAAKMLSFSQGLDMFDPEKAPADVREILKEAWAEGSFVPLESFDLMMTARQRNVGARKGVKAFNTTTQVVSLSFTFAERMNRLVTFIAAARIAQKPAVKENAKKVLAGDALARAEVLRDWNPKSFAEWAVDESQYRMGKANRPTVMRGVGAAILQFKGFMMQTFEAWYRMAALHGPDGKKAAAASILALYAFAGIWGLPGADDLRKLLENIYKTITGKDLDMKTELRAWIAKKSGSNALALMVNKGMPYPLGVDLTRVGMGSVAPNSPLAAAGIPFDMLIGRPKRAFEKASVGDELGAAAELTPNFIKHWLVAGSWALEGVRDNKGNRILLPKDLSAGDLAMKSLGFQPSVVTDIRDYEYAERRMETAVDALKRGYTAKLARTIVEMENATDPKELKKLDERLGDIYAEIDKHNDTASPEQIIRISNRSLRQKIMRESEGVKSTWGKERKAARGSAEELRGVFGLSKENDE